MEDLGNITPLELRRYVTVVGKIPFGEWLGSLRDRKTQHLIEARLARVAIGLLGDNKWVAPGIFELRIDYGPGYRIYFGRDGRTVILLLCAGNKRNQSKDISLALNYWLDYLKRGKQ